MNNREQVLEEARELGVYIRRNVDMTPEKFYNWCSYISIPWTEEIHKIHKEDLGLDSVVRWSNKNAFKGHSLPWHADNPWHHDYKFPLRVLWGSKIPNPKNDILHFLHITNWFEDQDKSTKEYFRSLKVLVQDYKKTCQPYWTSFVKKHPITKKESFNWGSMAIDSKVFGLSPDEGQRFPHFSYTMAIEKDNRELISKEEIESWFHSMITDKYMISHQWNEKDLLVLDNWVSLHYIGRRDYREERLLWRKTLLQPWQTIG